MQPCRAFYPEITQYLPEKQIDRRMDMSIQYLWLIKRNSNQWDLFVQKGQPGFLGGAVGLEAIFSHFLKKCEFMQKTLFLYCKDSEKVSYASLRKI